MGEAMSSFVTRLVSFVMTVAGLGAVRVSARMKGGMLMDLGACTLEAYVNGSRYMCQSVSCSDA